MQTSAIYRPRIEKRLNQPESLSQKITLYGKYNDYPQRIEELINNSGTAFQCTDLYNDFLFGEGFLQEDLNDIIINRRGETLENLHELITSDFAKFRGCAIQVHYNLLYQISALEYIPFEMVRWGLSDSNLNIPKVHVHPDWANYNERIVDQNNFGAIDAEQYDVFNPNEFVVKAQIDHAGGIRKYKGQVLYLTPQHGRYPISPIGAVYEDVETEIEAKHFRKQGITTNFLATHIIKTPAGLFETDKQRQAFDKLLSETQGARKAAKFIHMHGLQQDVLSNKFLEKVDIQDVDKLYEYTEKTAKSSIIDAFKIPQSLFSKFEGSALNSSSQIYVEAARQYNRVTNRDRNKLKKMYEKIGRYWPAINGRDMTIKELYLEENDTTVHHTGDDPTVRDAPSPSDD